MMHICPTCNSSARDNCEQDQVAMQLLICNQELASQARQIDKLNTSLRRSGEDLSQFAYVASHDLQEPLRKVIAFCQALQEDYNDRLDGTARDYIRHAVDGAHRMKTLVADLLSYSRVQTRGKPLAPTDSRNACDEAIHNLSSAIEETRAEVTHNELPVVQADRTQLVSVFENLIGNAIKYRGLERPIVHIAANELNEACVFRITDNGIGIDPHYHERIFVIFQRLHARDQYSGTGIGLALCKAIVERAGGRIWVESTLGAGSTFCFTMTQPQSIQLEIHQESGRCFAGDDRNIG